MNPEDFFDTAENLKQSPKEADLRTSISRSYYAIFLHFREYLAKRGIIKKSKQSPHSFVQACLSNSEVTEASQLSVKLHDLARKRTKADYDMKAIITKTEAEDTLEDARDAIQDYHSSMTSDKEKLLSSKAKYFIDLNHL